MTSRFRDALGLDTRTLAAVAVGAVTWASAAAARWWGGAALVVALACAAVAIGAIGWRPLTAVCAVAALAGWWSGHGATVRQEAILAYETPPGQVAMRVRRDGRKLRARARTRRSPAGPRRSRCSSPRVVRCLESPGTG